MSLPPPEGDDPNGLVEVAAEAVAPIEQELRERLVAEIDERDSLALETALLKAFINGMRAGRSEAAEPLLEQAGGISGFALPSPGAPLLPESPLPWVDPWAAKYDGPQ